MKLLRKLLVLLAAALMVVAAGVESSPAPAAMEGHAFAPPNVTWAHLFAANRR